MAHGLSTMEITHNESKVSLINCIHKTIVDIINFFQTLKVKPFLCDVCSKERTSNDRGRALHLSCCRTSFELA